MTAAVVVSPLCKNKYILKPHTCLELSRNLRSTQDIGFLLLSPPLP